MCIIPPNITRKARPKIFFVSGGFALQKLGRSVENSFFFGENLFAAVCSK